MDLALPFQAIAIVPTRELAVQVEAELRRFAKHKPLRFALAYGGTKVQGNLKQLGHQPHFVVGTPGRIMDLEERGALVYTIRSVGNATHALVTRAAGDSIGLRGPFGTSWPLRETRGRDLLVVAGGIGLAPLRPVIFHVLRHRGDYGRLIVLYGSRSPKDLLFRKQLVQHQLLLSR